ncbi:MAG: TadE/TadG family type IV pilus assembly protein [Phycicoccus sp.]
MRDRTRRATRPGPGRRRAERGSATLELVATMPLLLLFGLLALQVGVYLWVVASTNDAVRQGARAASLGGDGCAAATLALGQGLPPRGCAVTSGPGGGAGVEVVVQAPGIPMVERFAPTITVTRKAFMP